MTTNLQYVLNPKQSMPPLLIFVTKINLHFLLLTLKFITTDKRIQVSSLQ